MVERMSAAKSIALLCLLVGVIGSWGARAQSSGSDLMLGPVRLAGNEPSYLDLGAGAFDLQGHPGTGTLAEGKVEFRYGQKLFYIGPAIGLLANTKGGVFGYAGFYADFALGPVVLTPLAAVGGYHRGGSEDLGEVFQFRTGGTVSYQFDNQSRLGVQFAHISNAGLSSHNPGENELLLTYAIPLNLPF
jgi:lipid A 3-O-deacylase